MYEAISHEIRVRVEPHYLPDQSKPEAHQFLWAYSITIENTGKQTVQLLSRHWEITDAKGRTEVVDGPGVVGEQPILRPGERFSYTSGAPLSTPTGFMVGHYVMSCEDGQSFLAEVPAFSLDSPYQPLKLQ